jgi:hypothetical protein
MLFYRNLFYANESNRYQGESKMLQPIEKDVKSRIIAFPESTYIETIAEDVEREWRHNGRLVIFRLKNVTRASIDAFIDSQLQGIRTFPVGLMMFSMLDISGDAMTLTPYFRDRLEELVAAISQRNLTGYSAIVMPDGFKHRIFRVMSQFFPRQVGKFEQKYFLDREEGKLWIEEKMGIK